MWQRVLDSGILVAFLALSGSAQARVPEGEVAHYQIDTAAARTSGMVSGGTITATMGGHTTDGSLPSYLLKLDYALEIIFGEQTGTKHAHIDDAYFTPEFIAQLRGTKHYESANFKIDYLGVSDATTLDGHSYPNCDKILIYEIADAGLQGLALALLAPQVDLQANPQATIDNMKITAQVYPGIPAISAVKLDMTGTYSGSAVKAGADYQTP